ncbi:MAG: hypothetical protein WBC82_11365 [Dehalococcoidia bacterium]
MTLQIIPVTVAEGYIDAAGNPLRDLPFLAPANTERPLFRFGPEQLDGAGFSFSCVWMQLTALWTIRRLLTRQGEVITSGIPLTGSGVDLLAVIRSKSTAPAGQLWYGFDDGSTGKPGREDWRGRAPMYYRPSALVVLLDGTARALL